jgi:capsular exopolysaccharide synthesis family protein
MSKIYESLQQAHQQKKTNGKNLETIIPRNVPQNLFNREELRIGEEMLSLYKVIDTLLSDVKNPVIQFIGSGAGEGTSTIVRELAKTVADRIGYRVLLVDADRCEGAQSKFYSVESQFGWTEALLESSDVGRAIYQVNDSSLFVSPASNGCVPTPELFNSPFDEIWANLKHRFDLVFIDSPPLTISPDALAIAAKVDGVIMVLEAERTKWRTAKYVREKIEMVGGKVLGVVLNKRRYYIPRSIYKYLYAGE